MDELLKDLLELTDIEVIKGSSRIDLAYQLGLIRGRVEREIENGKRTTPTVPGE